MKLTQNHVLLAGLIGVASIYYLFDPSLTVWMPRCPLQQQTGFFCPGCGSQRALYALLHGHFQQAVSHNMVFVLALGALPLLAGRRVRSLMVKPRVLTFVALLIAVFGVARNMTAFEWLAP